jgi:DNA (cytosine-5)-methyltransferase 1
VAAQLLKVLGEKSSLPSEEIILKDADVLQIKMVEAAKRYGVDPHVIEPRRKNLC